MGNLKWGLIAFFSPFSSFFIFFFFCFGSRVKYIFPFVSFRLLLEIRHNWVRLGFVNRRQDLGGSFKLLWILRCCIYWGGNKGYPYHPIEWNSGILPLLFDETGYSLPPSHFDEAEVSPQTRWMHHGYQLTCSAVYMEAGSLETCIAMTSFH